MNAYRLRELLAALCILFLSFTQPSHAQQAPLNQILLRNVRVLDVVSGQLGPSTSVLIRGNRIAAIGPTAAAAT